MGNKKMFKKVLSMILICSVAMLLMPVQAVFAAATAAPGKPTLQSNQWGPDVDGNYDLTVNMHYGNNATSYKLYESFGIEQPYKVVAEGKLEDKTPSAQSAVAQIRDRKAVGMYSYYVEFINEFGATKSDVVQVKVGKEGAANILIDTVDNDGVKCQMTVKQGKSEYKLTNRANSNAKFAVISSNTSVAKASINGNILTIDAVKDGRTGLKIVDESTGDIRQIGVRVKKADGSLPGMPEYLSLGQVSEDTDNDLNFWKDTSNTDTNKFTDIRYIYMNGGPFDGWRSWTSEDGDRAKNYIRESLKLGMIPFFVYYNIPDKDESYDVDLKHINDKAYMEGYYKDLIYLLDICKEYADDETIGMIFEPDFLGYMMQKSGKKPNEISALVDAAYSSGVLVKGKDPTFENNVKGLVESINYIIDSYHKPAYFGWQFNIWSYDSPEIPNQGLLHKTEFIGQDSGQQFIKQVAQETAQYYMSAGITSYGADFISIDKYGLDGGFEDGSVDNPKASKWLWNADLWNNYLLYTKTLHQETKKPVILWQIPVGHINGSQEPNPYNGGKFADLTNKVGNYEDSAPTFFFGDTFIPGKGNRADYFGLNASNDSKIKVSGDTVTWGSHMEETRDAGVVSILFGAGVNGSTDAVGSPASDNYWWITKAQRYLKNPLSLSGGSSVDPSKLPEKATLECDSLESNGNYTVSIKVPAKSKATSYKLYENGTNVKEGTLTDEATVIAHKVINKPTGTYMYNVELINADGSTSSDNMTVKVNNTTVPPIDVPGKAKLTLVQGTTKDSYSIDVEIPAKSKATSYRLYENDKIIKTGDVTEIAQKFTVDFKDKATGDYEYRLDLINKDATTTGDVLKVTSTSSSTQNGVNVDFFVMSDWGSGANFEIVLTNNTDADINNWTLDFDFEKEIKSVPNADLKVNGKSYTITPKAWNGTIKKGDKLVLAGSCEGMVKNIVLKNVKVSYK